MINGQTVEERCWVQLYGGGRFYPLDPGRFPISIEAIAHGLAKEPRFSGQTQGDAGLSVAQHAISVSHFCDPEDALWGLVHDAPEGLGLHDIPTPIKRLPQMAGYVELERLVMAAVCDQLGLPHEMPASVKHADRLALAIEARALHAPLDPEWLEYIADIEVPEEMQMVDVWPAPVARKRFLERFEELTRNGRR
jgi:hypothetical protein